MYSCTSKLYYNTTRQVSPGLQCRDSKARVVSVCVYVLQKVCVYICKSVHLYVCVCVCVCVYTLWLRGWNSKSGSWTQTQPCPWQLCNYICDFKHYLVSISLFFFLAIPCSMWGLSWIETRPPCTGSSVS